MTLIALSRSPKTEVNSKSLSTLNLSIRSHAKTCTRRFLHGDAVNRLHTKSMSNPTIRKGEVERPEEAVDFSQPRETQRERQLENRSDRICDQVTPILHASLVANCISFLSFLLYLISVLYSARLRRRRARGRIARAQSPTPPTTQPTQEFNRGVELDTIPAITIVLNPDNSFECVEQPELDISELPIVPGAVVMADQVAESDRTGQSNQPDDLESNDDVTSV